MRRRFLALCAAVALLVAGCSSGHHAAAPTTTTLPPGHTAGSPNPDVIPPVITPAYVNAVFAALNHVDGDATRQMVSSGSVTPRAQADLRAIYNDPLFTQELRIAEQSLKAGTRGVRRPPGDVVTTVSKMISATPTCIFVATTSDFSAVLVNPGTPAASEYWVLRPKQRNGDPRKLNPTPWALAFNADYLTPTTIPDQCSGS